MMTNIFANWEQILKFAREYGLTENKKRAIVREYLQVKIISIIYSQKISRNLFFVGGTALRLLYGLNRFSEDLDFDTLNIKDSEIENLLDSTADILKKENFEAVYYKNKTKKKIFYELRFSKILLELGISKNQSENLAIKFDFEPFWKGQEQKNILFNRYGFLASVVTKNLNQFVVEKLVAYLNREQTLARDLYDLVWLASQGAKPDRDFALINGYKIDNIIGKAKEKFKKENVGKLKELIGKFLLDDTEAEKIQFFDKLY